MILKAKDHGYYAEVSFTIAPDVREVILPMNHALGAKERVQDAHNISGVQTETYLFAESGGIVAAVTIESGNPLDLDDVLFEAAEAGFDAIDRHYVGDSKDLPDPWRVMIVNRERMGENARNADPVDRTIDGGDDHGGDDHGGDEGDPRVPVGGPTGGGNLPGANR